MSLDAGSEWTVTPRPFCRFIKIPEQSSESMALHTHMQHIPHPHAAYLIWTTLVPHSSAQGVLHQALKRTHARGADPDRALHQAAAVISRLSDALRLQRNIRDRASELFKQIAPINLTRGRGMEAVCCAVLYTACRLERTPREGHYLLASLFSLHTLPSLIIFE